MASNEKDKEQEKAIDQRPNYFAGQYLLEDDFLLEQKYHIDRQRRHNRLLHVSGIAEGLKVSEDKDLAVKVSAGTAIDSQGRQIILPDDRAVELENNANKKPIEDGEYTLSIRYEELTEKQDSEESMARRVQEKPKLELSKSTTPDVIPLAKLKIKGGKVENIDRSVRQYSGICLPTEDGNGVTLRSQREDNTNIAQLNGGLSISGKLYVTGPTQLNNTLTVTESTTINNNLTVKSLRVGENETGFTLRSPGEENPNLADLTGSLSISGTLAVKESISVGENEYVINLQVPTRAFPPIASLDGGLRISSSLEVTGNTELNGYLDVKKDMTVKQTLQATSIGINTSVNNGALEVVGDIFANGNIIILGGVRITKNMIQTGDPFELPWVFEDNPDLGLYSNDFNRDMRFVTNSGNFYFSSTGKYGDKNDPLLKIDQEGNITAQGTIKGKKCGYQDYDLNYFIQKKEDAGYIISGNREVKMHPSDNSVAFLTSIGGSFNGDGEKVWIETRNENNVNYWYLCAKTAANPGHIIAKARCIEMYG
ncbi:hypothetical protein C7B67_21870 [filamentous cyanobacterium Phorm 6]|nr:hypothetical protein C7B67_21870 [filamentous cyanobacterium Phorm 6]